VRIDREAQGVDLRTIAPEGLSVLVDPDRLGQVFVNLLRNAADAMDGEGAITVRAEPVERDGRRWVSIRVQDEGPGITPDVLSRLFEPFVSTRLDARGTGLGLAVSEGIIREHGGVILARNLANEPQGPSPEGAEPANRRQGAEFEIVLPDEDDAPASSFAESAPFEDDGPTDPSEGGVRISSQSTP
jgi:signal transduction histidine kinase